MNIRILKEEREENFLSPFAIKSKNSKGREKYEEKCDIRTCFQRDRDRIIHSKAFRRLKHKTQVFISPEGDHFRTRLTHTLEVSQIARTIASSLFLNEDLTEAIALGHDLGHTPFGHLGEDALSKICENDFHHNEQSVRVVQKLEKNGEGLNLTFEVLDGILNHRGRCNPSTLEGKVVQISDKIAYINHDIDDAIRAGFLKQEDLPKECTSMLGNTPKEIINFLIRNIIKNSYGKNEITMEKEVKASMYT
ncbi:MAG: deoxyguanosinetriphosphate triphosphohydrolase, partial [Eubacteriales bacterium]|nr:deoxyguanosinetriphosphate triphosphohydrolase [Eubacteriales bacterium]